MIPRSCGIEAITEVLKLCQHHQSQSLLCGLKAHGSDDFILSYSGDGYSVGIDIQLRGRSRPQVEKFARTLFEYTLRYGGKVHLAKDELLPRDLFKRMYPHYQEFLQIKNEIDPEYLFASDMYRRLLK